MIEIFCKNNERVVTLSSEEVMELHKILCNNYKLLPEMEPISPPGIKNRDMLESAVSRQLVGSGDFYKYDDIFSNCATLVFGLVKNHSFHNGNKRIGFLAMLKHLYTNGHVIRPGINHSEIYELLRALADSSLYEHAQQFYQDFFKVNRIHLWNDEISIKYLAYWLKKNTEFKRKKIKQKSLSVNDLERILKAKQLSTDFSGKYLSVERKNSFFGDLLGKKPFKRQYIIKDSRNVAFNLIDQIRKDFEITFLDGVDNSSFYNDEEILNNEIVSYKRIIYKLAKT